jgi:hypothetical protein
MCRRVPASINRLSVSLRNRPPDSPFLIDIRISMTVSHDSCRHHGRLFLRRPASYSTVVSSRTNQRRLLMSARRLLSSSKQILSLFSELSDDRPNRSSCKQLFFGSDEVPLTIWPVLHSFRRSSESFFRSHLFDRQQPVDSPQTPAYSIDGRFYASPQLSPYLLSSLLCGASSNVRASK